MRSSGSIGLRFAANLGFAHFHCSRCKEERLHLKGKCVSCRTLHKSHRFTRKARWDDFKIPPGSMNRKQRKLVETKSPLELAADALLGEAA